MVLHGACATVHLASCRAPIVRCGEHPAFLVLSCHSTTRCRRAFLFTVRTTVPPSTLFAVFGDSNHDTAIHRDKHLIWRWPDENKSGAAEWEMPSRTGQPRLWLSSENSFIQRRAYNPALDLISTALWIRPTHDIGHPDMASLLTLEPLGITPASQFSWSGLMISFGMY